MSEKTNPTEATKDSAEKKSIKSVVKRKKRFAKVFLGKLKFRIRKPKDEKIFGSRVRNSIYIVVLFFFAVIFLNLQPNSNSMVQLWIVMAIEKLPFSYIFYDQAWNQYNIFGQPAEHGAPQSWEYLFEGVEVGTWPDLELPDREVDQTIVTSEAEPLSSWRVEEEPSGREEVEAPVPQKKKKGKIWKTFTFLIKDDLFAGKTLKVIREFEGGPGWLYQDAGKGKGIQIIPTYANCATPWGYEISHGQSLLAYQQDRNTPDTCKIERRFCWDGDLSGTFGQQSCSVNTEYSYFQEQFVSYNIPKNTSAGINLANNSLGGSTSSSSATSSPDRTGVGELIAKPNQQSTTRGKGSNSISSSPTAEQSERYYPSCKAPWGETIKHGQFVKAYRNKNGFSDAPCQVQLRTCVVGILEGRYAYPSCRHWDTSYIDRLDGSPTRDTYSEAKMQWIREIRANENNYQLEYGNTLKSSALDKILDILDM